MKLYSVNEYSEESGPGSSPIVSTYIFSTPEKRLAFIADWHQVKSAPGLFNQPEKDDQHTDKYFQGDYAYWLDYEELSIDEAYGKQY